MGWPRRAQRHNYTEWKNRLRRILFFDKLEPLVDHTAKVAEFAHNSATQARSGDAQFLEHLILKAELIWNFQPTVLPPPRPWWKLWGKDPEPEVPAIVADLRNVAWSSEQDCIKDPAAQMGRPASP